MSAFDDMRSGDEREIIKNKGQVKCTPYISIELSV